MQPLNRRYRLLTIASVVPLVLLIVALGVYQFLSLRERELETIRQSLIGQRIALDAVVKTARDHVQEMRQSAEDYPAAESLRPRSELRAMLAGREIQGQSATDGLVIDHPPPELIDKIGNFLGDPGVLERRSQDDREIDMALGLFPLTRAAHLSSPYFRWSYYFSAREDFLIIYPWAQSAATVGALGRSRMREFLRVSFAHAVFQRGTPKHNPGRRTYWLDPYLDEFGAGLMVSHAAPVYHGDRFMGMVGTDIVLEFLTDFLQRFARPVGRLWIVNNSRHQLLADSQGGLGGDEVRQLATVLPEPLRKADVEMLVSALHQFRTINGYYVLALPIEAAPWSMLYAASSSEINGMLLSTLAPYAVILAGLVLTFFCAQFLLRRYFVAPAFALANYIGSEARDEGQSAPRVPRMWQPWLDMTAHAFKAKRIKEAAEAARERADAANRAKSVFLANMSHELRTPLNGILGYAQILLKDNALAAKHRNGLDIIYNSGEYLLGLINDILDLARIESRKLTRHAEDFSLADFLDNIKAMFEPKTTQLKVRHEVDGDLPVYVRGDKQKINQILLNLIDNAIKFTEQGEVVFSVRREQEDMVRFTVADSGCGIKAEDLERIFESFQQAGEHARTSQGTGLGLAISHAMVELLGGTLNVESELGKGSRFWFCIPLPEADVVLAPLSIAERKIIGYQGERRRVLVVDDIAQNRSVLIDLLQPLGFELAQAGNGQAAIEAAIAFRPDLIFMDLRMPVMNGLEATQRIREIEALKEAKIVAISASAFSHNRAQCVEAGADDFLPKPFRHEQLLEALGAHLKLTWSCEREVEERVTSLVAPCDEEIEKLIELARRGDIKHILEEADRLERDDASYARFAAEIRQLASRFQVKKISEFLTGMQSRG